uniref:Uncharacterized protein n=1 Tax=Anguilla anguilla TaxID=7936 RepID=A0A0E9WG77_ANGAN
MATSASSEGLMSSSRKGSPGFCARWAFARLMASRTSSSSSAVFFFESRKRRISSSIFSSTASTLLSIR